MWSPADVMSAGATAPARPRRRRFPPWVAAAGWLPARRQPSLPRWRLARHRAVGSLARAACGVASGRRRVVRESEAEAKIADGFRNQTSHTHVGVCELGRLPIELQGKERSWATGPSWAGVLKLLFFVRDRHGAPAGP